MVVCCLLCPSPVAKIRIGSVGGANASPTVSPKPERSDFRILIGIGICVEGLHQVNDDGRWKRNEEGCNRITILEPPLHCRKMLDRALFVRYISRGQYGIDDDDAEQKKKEGELTLIVILLFVFPGNLFRTMERNLRAPAERARSSTGYDEDGVQ